MTPASGTLTSAQSTTMTICLNANALALPAGVHSGALRLTNLRSGYTYPLEVVARVDMPDYYTELFDANDNDLENQTLTFVPDGSFNYYSVCRQATTGFPIDPAGGTPLPLSDDDYEQVNLTGGALVSLYGAIYGTFYVGSNGYITFGYGDYTLGESFASHFSQPRIAAVFDDLNPGVGGSVTWKQLSDRAVVTFENVPEYGQTNINSFQFEMFFNGTIRLTHLRIDVLDGLAGLSRGQGVPLDFVESDLSAYPLCDSLTITPLGGFSSVGPIGGPFVPPSTIYTLVNVGSSSLDWTAAITQPWLDVSSAGGTLPYGIPAHLTISLNSHADALTTPGTYADILTVTNVTSGYIYRLPVQLTIVPPPPVIRIETPLLLQATLWKDEATSFDPGLIIRNDGGDFLEYGLRVGYVGRTGEGQEAKGKEQEAKIRATIDALVEKSGVRKVPVTVSAASIFGGGGKTATVTLTRPEEIANVQTAAERDIPTSSALNVAVCAADVSPYLSDVQAKLLATGQFHSVSVINAGAITPTVADLAAFDSVMVWRNIDYANSIELGNALADYVKYGGGVVCAVFETGGSGSVLQGEWATGGFVLVDRLGTTDGRSSMGAVLVPSHPIMAGVSAFDGGNYSFRPYATDAISGATRIANWADGRPLVVARELYGGQRVDLGFFPVSSSADLSFWNTATDGARLMANALTWAATPSGWLAIERPRYRLVSQGQASEHWIDFDATGLSAGLHVAFIQVSHNDSSTGPIDIRCELTVLTTTTLTLLAEGHGRVAVDDTPHDLPWSGYFVSTATLQLEAAPDFGWVFNHWSGGLTGIQSPATLHMIADTTVTAHFVRVPPVIACSPSSVTRQVAEGSGPVERVLSVWNAAATGTLNYTVAAPVSWLTISPTSGSVMAIPSTHTLRIDSAALAVGHHATTLSIVAAAATNSPFGVPIVVDVQNVLPSVEIVSISPNPAQPPLDQISFQATGSDPLGAISSWQWHSSQDGVLSALEDFQMPSDRLTVGLHTITLTGWDEEGTAANDTTSLTIQNAPPMASIVSLMPNPVVAGEMVAVAVTGQDRDESGRSIAGAELLWVDGLHSAIMPGIHQLAVPMTSGTHTVTYRVRDDEGTWSTPSSASLTVLPNVNLHIAEADFAPEAPILLQPGDSLALGALVENTGLQHCPPFWLEFWGSRTGGLMLDYLVVQSQVIGSMAAGMTANVETTRSLYTVPDGPYTMVFVADRPGGVPETNECDNRTIVRGKRLVVLRPPTQVDLVVGAFSIDTDPAYSGMPIDFGGYVQNIGAEDSGAFWVEFWASAPGDYPATHFMLCDSILIANLAPGTSVPLSSYTRTLYPVPQGPLWAGCFVDRIDQVNELDETNNYQFLPNHIFNQSAAVVGQTPTAEQAPLADLLVTECDYAPSGPTASQPGDTITLTVTVANRGTTPSVPCYLEFWGSKMGGLDLGHMLLTPSEILPSLDAGSSLTLSLAENIMGVPDGPHTLVLVIDRPGQVAESNKTNNRLAVPRKRVVVLRPMTGANLVVEGFAIGPDPLEIGGQCQITATVRNTGTAESGSFWIEFWIADNQCYPNLLLMLCDSVRVGNLGADQTIGLVNEARTVYDSLPAGTFAVGCFVDRIDQVNESEESDNYEFLLNRQMVLTAPPH